MLIFLKLGGSLITDKRQPEMPRMDVLQRLAQEERGHGCHQQQEPGRRRGHQPPQQQRFQQKSPAAVLRRQRNRPPTRPGFLFCGAGICGHGVEMMGET